MISPLPNPPDDFTLYVLRGEFVPTIANLDMINLWNRELNRRHIEVVYPGQHKTNSFFAQVLDFNINPTISFIWKNHETLRRVNIRICFNGTARTFFIVRDDVHDFVEGRIVICTVLEELFFA